MTDNAFISSEEATVLNRTALVALRTKIIYILFTIISHVTTLTLAVLVAHKRFKDTRTIHVKLTTQTPIIATITH